MSNKVCKFCSKRFIYKRGSRAGYFYCSSHCQESAKKLQDKENHKKRLKGFRNTSFYSGYCLKCGKPFFSIHSRTKYCSESCASRARAQKFRNKNSDKLFVKTIAYLNYCENCGKPFFSARKKKFCSETCMSRFYYHKNMTEEKRVRQNRKYRNRYKNNKQFRDNEKFRSQLAKAKIPLWLARGRLGIKKENENKFIELIECKQLSMKISKQLKEVQDEKYNRT